MSSLVGGPSVVGGLGSGAPSPPPKSGPAGVDSWPSRGHHEQFVRPVLLTAFIGLLGLYAYNCDHMAGRRNDIEVG